MKALLNVASEKILVMRKNSTGPLRPVATRIHSDQLVAHLDQVISIEKIGLGGIRKNIFSAAVLGRAPLSQEFFFPFEKSTYAIRSWNEGSYILTIAAPPRSSIKNIGKNGFLRSYAFSLTIHVSIVALIIASGFFQSFFKRSSRTEATSSPKSVAPDKSQPSSPTFVAISNRVAFQGGSLWLSLASRDPRQATQKLSSLLTQELNSRPTKPLRGNGQNIKSAFAADDSTLNLKVPQKNLDLTDLPETNNLPAKTPVKAVSAAEREQAQAELKRSMENLQSRFRTYYDDALKRDPSFNVHFVLSAQVSAQGHLKDLQLRASGHSPDQLALMQELSNRIKHDIAALPVSKSLDGYFLRREFVFWR